jgi:hypothetical protein
MSVIAFPGGFHRRRRTARRQVRDLPHRALFWFVIGGVVGALLGATAATSAAHGALLHVAVWR